MLLENQLQLNATLLCLLKYVVDSHIDNFY